QGHRRHGSGGYTLIILYRAGGKRRGTAAGQDRAGSAVYGTRGTEDKRTKEQEKKEKGKEYKRTEGQKTEEQKNKNRWKGEQEQGGTRTGKSP
ncbi:MAG: hypothetical protein J5942_03740, partial [Prevotella sp.]|nr:hypothetical protein [Prevotella sp.]